ncbi:glucose-1-phosphate thymidylyltransferase [Nitrososphaera sp.]|uniref:glucose-1-phosphate thymidylyltransferase n=1 Tax=Nitrososphaera sp. TaxID=1971748 RepID=UPI00307DA76F
MKGVILHGGHGTRLRPLTHTGPKQLLTIGNKPMSKYALDDLVEAGITDIAMIIGDVYPEKVKEYYGDGAKFGAKITYIYQEKPGGIAQAINLCKEFVGNDKFVVYLGDNILKGGIKEYASTFNSSSADALILLCEVDDPSRFGIATVKDDRIERIVEKPKNADSNLAVIGIYFLTPDIFSIIDVLKPSGRGELEITEALQNLMRNGKRIEYDYVTGWWKDTGTPQDILDANRFMLDEVKRQIDGQVDSENSIQGRVAIGSNTKVASGATIRGPAVVGTGCKIEAGVYIGPYTSIGNNVVIRKGELENCIIMDSCEIEASGRLVDSIIGAGSKILDAHAMSPRGHRFLLGERSQVML